MTELTIVRNLFVLLLAVTFCSCASYKSNILLRSDEQNVPEVLSSEAKVTEREYLIKKFDHLDIQIYSNGGEKLIDPSPELSNPSGGTTGKTENAQSSSPKFQVDSNGLLKLPLIGEIKLEGLSIKQAEEILQKEYAKFFKDPFVKLSYSNKRVVVLGGTIAGQVVPLTNQDTRVAEILAETKMLTHDARANSIRLVRNDHVYHIDLSTIRGFKEGNILVEPGDIIYVEPVRRPVTEGFRDNYFVFSIVVGLASLAAIVRSFRQ